MREDFDTLCTTIKRVSPHIQVKKDLWNYNALKEIAATRGRIDTISSDLSFYLLLLQTVNRAQDSHTSLIEPQSLWVKQQAGIYGQLRSLFKLSFAHEYSGGRYIVSSPFRAGGDTIPVGSQVVSVDHQPVDQYVRGHLWARGDARFDIKLKKFYCLGFYKNTETVFRDTLAFTFKKPDGRISSLNMPTRQFVDFLPHEEAAEKDTSRVEFWDDARILYIRLAEMDPEAIPALKSRIHAFAGSLNDQSKIVVDFRNNPGGEDTAWMELYSSILPDKILTRLKIDQTFDPSLPADQDPLLKKFHFSVYTQSKDSILPDEHSIRFRGPIYVLAENYYSSAGSAMRIPNANKADRFYTVGRKTGYFLGIGLSPVQFVLPHSGLRFRIAPSMETSDAHSLQDLMFDDVEMEAPYSVQDMINRYYLSGKMSRKAFMLQYDPYFKVILR